MYLYSGVLNTILHMSPNIGPKHNVPWCLVLCIIVMMEENMGRNTCNETIVSDDVLFDISIWRKGILFTFAMKKKLISDDMFFVAATPLCSQQKGKALSSYKSLRVQHSGNFPLRKDANAGLPECTTLLNDNGFDPSNNLVLTCFSIQFWL